tara:strand:- start:5145 stop:6077 length:933 start_codon:yes stop_codon:yes gene_type:complete
MSVLNAEQKSAMMTDLGLDGGSPPAESSGATETALATENETDGHAGAETSSSATSREDEGTTQDAEGSDSPEEKKGGKSTQRRRRRRGRFPASALHGERRKRQAAQSQLSESEGTVGALQQRLASLESRLESSSNQTRESTSDDWLENLLGESGEEDSSPQTQKLLDRIGELERSVKSNASNSAENTFYAEVDEVLETFPNLEDYFEDPEAVFVQAIQINPKADLYEVAKKSIEWYEAQEKRILERHSKRQSKRPEIAPRLRPAGGSGVNSPEPAEGADVPKGKGIKAISNWLRNRDQRRRKEEVERYPI